MSREKLPDVKVSHPLQIADYAVAMCVDHEPSFIWWVLNVLKKRDAIIALVKKFSAGMKHMHKFGIECLKMQKTNSNLLSTTAILHGLMQYQGDKEYLSGIPYP